MNWFALLKLLVAATQFVQTMLAEAAEKKKAGNLELINAAVSEYTSAKTDEEKDEAARKIQAAFESR